MYMTADQRFDRRIPGYVDAAPMFEPIDLPSGLERLSGRLLADLFDLILTWGFFMDVVPRRELVIRMPQSLPVAAMVPKMYFGIVTMCVGEPCTTQISIPSGIVWWNSNITPADVRSAIREKDGRMIQDGFMDPFTGFRTDVYDPSVAGGTLHTDEIFTKPEMMIPLPNGRLTLNTFLGRFIPKDSVTHVTLSDGLRICRASDAALIREKDEIQSSIRNAHYQRHKIYTQEDLAALPKGQYRQLEQEIEAEIAAALAKLTRG